MTKVVGIRFRTAGKIYFFDPVGLEIKRGTHVIVETARGIEFGTAVNDVKEVEDDKVVQPLKPVLRIATEKDEQQQKNNLEKEKEAYKTCLGKIREHGLDMKLIDTEYTFDNNKVLFYFTSDGRVDFRELVKDLASVFRTRIELRQIGVRDETKLLGGIGICGRPLCCHTHLSDFNPVSIKMAKEQGLSLNPTKISGVCGRLMCCLNHEEETYEELNKHLPNVGDYVTTPEGDKGEVHSVNVLRQKVKVLIDVGDEKEIHEYLADELTFKKSFRRDNKNLTKEELAEMKELEKMEREDREDSAEEERNNGKRGGNKDRKPKRDGQGGPKSDNQNQKKDNNQNQNGQNGQNHNGHKKNHNRGKWNKDKQHHDGQQSNQPDKPVSHE